MSLSPQEIALIRDSYDAVRLQIEPASTAFYDFLFDRDASVKRLFREDLAGQGMKFMTTLGLIVEALDDPGALSRRLEKLGSFHGAIGVKALDFEPMEAALMDMFDLILGRDFTPETRAAWRKAYRQIASEMIAAGAKEKR